MDLALRYGPTANMPPHAMRLFGEQLTPVASPWLLKSGAPLKKPADLTQFALIEAGDAHQTHLEWLTWRRWFDENGSPKLQPKRWLYFNYAYQMVQAALTGQGVVLARLPMVAESLANGDLVEPLPHQRMDSPMAYWLIVGPRSEQRPEIRSGDGTTSTFPLRRRLRPRQARAGRRRRSSSESSASSAASSARRSPGTSARTRSRRSRRARARPPGRASPWQGWILGIIGTIFLVLGVIWIFFMGGLAIMAAMAERRAATRQAVRRCRRCGYWWATGLGLVALFLALGLLGPGRRRRPGPLPLSSRHRRGLSGLRADARRGGARAGASSRSPGAGIRCSRFSPPRSRSSGWPGAWRCAGRRLPARCRTAGSARVPCPPRAAADRARAADRDRSPAAPGLDRAPRDRNAAGVKRAGRGGVRLERSRPLAPALASRRPRRRRPPRLRLEPPAGEAAHGAPRARERSAATRSGSRPGCTGAGCAAASPPRAASTPRRCPRRRLRRGELPRARASRALRPLDGSRNCGSAVD